jgi:hypothetical protein
MCVGRDEVNCGKQEEYEVCVEESARILHRKRRSLAPNERTSDSLAVNKFFTCASASPTSSPCAGRKTFHESSPNRWTVRRTPTSLRASSSSSRYSFAPEIELDDCKPLTIKDTRFERTHRPRICVVGDRSDKNAGLRRQFF